MKSLKSLASLTLVLTLGLSPLTVGNAMATTTHATTSKATDSTTSIALGFFQSNAGVVVLCSYNENHTYDIAGNLIGYRSASNPMIICNAAGTQIGYLTPISTLPL
jgi:hypothetical protein